MIKILIAVPTFENICPETFKSIYDLKKPKNCRVDFRYIRGYDCARARNEIVNLVKKSNYDYVLMVDSDVILPENALVCLMEDSPNVVVGAYPRKRDPSKSEVFGIEKADYSDENRLQIDFLKKYMCNRIEIRGAGAGCLLIKASIFDELKYPYFKYVVYNAKGSFLSEDLYFCEAVRKLNYKIYVDTRVICKHVGRKIVG